MSRFDVLGQFNFAGGKVVAQLAVALLPRATLFGLKRIFRGHAGLKKNSKVCIWFVIKLYEKFTGVLNWL